MAQRRDRVIALILAIVFFATSVGVSFAVVWQLIWGNDQDTNTQEVSMDKLQGTPLADFTPLAKVDSLQIIDQQVGTGQEVKAGDIVEVDYTGAVAATGIIFQSSLDAKRTVPIKLVGGPEGVISGWVDGLVGVKEGGKRRLILPAASAYGANPPTGSGIPPDAPLVFDITVHGIVPPSEAQ